MEVKIIKANDPVGLQEEVNAFLKFAPPVHSVNMAVGAYPGYAEFYAIILFERV